MKESANKIKPRIKAKRAPTARFAVRKARSSDAAAIKAIITPYSRTGVLLPRTVEDIKNHINDFSVASLGDCVLGVGALHHYGNGLAEVRTLAVPKNMKKRGIGSAIVGRLILHARRRKISAVFVMTVAPEFFKRLGFRKVPHAVLPEKVWKDCVKCVHYLTCDETAMLMELRG